MPADRWDYARYLWQMFDGFRVAHERRLHEWRLRDLEPLMTGRSLGRVLDLANGHLRPQYALLRARDRSTFGIDLVNRPSTTWTARSYQVLRWIYRTRAGLSSIGPDNTLACANVNHLPFGTATFDLVTTIAAFEHFLNVPTVITEACRVLRSGGLMWVYIHPFTCLSGGHNVSLSQIPLRRIPRGVDAWDHLRQRRLPFHVPLNEWRIPQYLAEFGKHFEIIHHYCAMREGEELLTSEIERELATYTRDELTCSAYIIVARRP